MDCGCKLTTYAKMEPKLTMMITSQLCAFLKYIVFEFNKRWYDELRPDCDVPMVSYLTGADMSPSCHTSIDGLRHSEQATYT